MCHSDLDPNSEIHCYCHIFDSKVVLFFSNFKCLSASTARGTSFLRLFCRHILRLFKGEIESILFYLQIDQ